VTCQVGEVTEPGPTLGQGYGGGVCARDAGFEEERLGGKGSTRGMPPR